MGINVHGVNLGLVFHHFLETNLFLVGPPAFGNGDLVGFWPVLGLGHLEKSGPGSKTEKHNSAVLGVLLAEKMLPHYPGWFSGTFSGTTFISVELPPVGNGDLVVFWPVLALGAWRNSGPRRKHENAISQCYGHFSGGNPSTPKNFPPKLRNFLPFLFWPPGPPKTGSRKLGF